MRAARMRDGQRGNPGARERCADGLDMRIHDRLYVEPDPQHAVLRILGDRRRAANAIDLDAFGRPEQCNRALDRGHVEHGAGVMQRLDVALEDLAHDRRAGVAGLEVFVDDLDPLHQFLRQQDLQLLEARRAQALAETDHAALARIGALGHFADRHMDHGLRIPGHEIGNALPGRPQRVPHAVNAREHRRRGGRRRRWLGGLRGLRSGR
ncbi:hypothetical protein D9M72_452370 [compost metagenome]